MKGNKVKIKLLVAMATTLICGLSLVGCNEEEVSAPVTLNSFTDTEVTAMLGENYELPTSTVTDTNGNEYQTVYKVWNSSGKEMVISDNAFFVDSMENYVIGCYVRVGADDIRSRFITVKVQDGGAPVITIQTAKKGLVGESYNLPKVTVIDGSGEVLSASVKLYAMDGEEKGEEITVEEGRFVPTVSGNYLIEATATDSSGNTATKSESFYIREAVRANELLSFDDETDIENIGSVGATVSYVNEFSGENGVAKFSYTGGYLANQFSFLPLNDVTDFYDLQSNYDTFVVRMYIVQSEDVKNAFTNLAIKDYETNTNYYSITPVEYNKWVDYKFEIEGLACFAGTQLNLFDRAKIWGYGNEELKGTDNEYQGEFYVADICAKNETSVNITGDTMLGSTLTIAGNGGTGAEITVISPSGSRTKLTDGTFTIAERGKHTVELSGLDTWALTEFTGTPYSFTERTVSWNGYSLATYGASNITANGSVLLGAGSYSGSKPQAMGTADIPYVAFNGEYSYDNTVVVDFTGANMPNVAFFADAPSADTKNFVGANGLMFSFGVLNKSGEISHTQVMGRMNLYGPTMFTKLDGTGAGDHWSASYAMGASDASLVTYMEMKEAPTTQYRMMFSFYAPQADGCIRLSVMIMEKNAQYDGTANTKEYNLVYNSGIVTRSNISYTDLTGGSIVIYGRPYEETQIDKIHTIYSGGTETSGAKLLEWTGTNPWAEGASTASTPVELALLPKNKEDF